MQFNLEQANSDYAIQSYKPGEVTISDIVYNHSLIIVAGQKITPWRPTSLADLIMDDIQSILKYAPKVVLLGTGNLLQFPSPKIMAEFTQAGIGLEVMNTGAACRTFNILLAEDRQVTAALFVT